MALQIAGRKIHRVRLIDDKVESRAVLSYPVEDLKLECVDEPGPIDDIDKYIRDFTVMGDAAICDHHLKESKGYSDYNGAEVVSRLFQAGLPAILCTRYEAARIFEDIRKYRQHIPILINPRDLGPDKIAEGFRLCLEEIRGNIPPSRKPWRTLVQVADIDTQINPNKPLADVVIPAWDANQIIRLLIDDIGESVRGKIQQGYRCHARVNLGADRQEDIFFTDWTE